MVLRRRNKQTEVAGQTRNKENVAMKLYKIWKNGKIVKSPIPGLYAGIVTMGIFGRLDCKSGMRAKLENRIFFHSWTDALKYPMRPCKNCKPVRRIEEEREIRRNEVKNGKTASQGF